MAESLDGYWELQDLRGLAELLHNLAVLLPVSETSVRLLAAAQTLNAATSAAPFQLDDDGATERAREELGHVRFEAASTQGRSLTAEQAFKEARRMLTNPRTEFAREVRSA